MTHGSWQSVRIEEIEPIEVAGVSWRALRRTLGVEAFGINAYTADAPGDHVVERHTEADLGHEEVYVVLSGRATFVLGEETLDAPAGTVVFVRDPSVQREATAEQAGTTVLAIGGKPGQAYAPSAWEAYFAVERFRPSGDHEAALAELAAAAEPTPTTRVSSTPSPAGTPSPASPTSPSTTRAGRSRSMRASASGRARTRISPRSTTACRRSFPAGWESAEADPRPRQPWASPQVGNPQKRIPDRDNP